MHAALFTILTLSPPRTFLALLGTASTPSTLQLEIQTNSWWRVKDCNVPTARPRAKLVGTARRAKPLRTTRQIASRVKKATRLSASSMIALDSASKATTTAAATIGRAAAAAEATTRAGVNGQTTCSSHTVRAEPRRRFLRTARLHRGKRMDGMVGHLC